jgi:hypothetical protein
VYDAEVTSWSRIFLEKLIVAQIFKFTPFMEPEVPLLCVEMLSTLSRNLQQSFKVEEFLP